MTGRVRAQPYGNGRVLKPVEVVGMKKNLFWLLAVLVGVAAVVAWNRSQPKIIVPASDPPDAAPSASALPEVEPTPRAIVKATPRKGPHLDIVLNGKGTLLVTLTNYGPEKVEVELYGAEGHLSRDDWEFSLMQGKQYLYPNNWCGTGLESGWTTLKPGEAVRSEVRTDFLANRFQASQPPLVHAATNIKVDGVRKEVLSLPVKVDITPRPEQRVQESDDGIVPTSRQIIRDTLPPEPESAHP